MDDKKETFDREYVRPNPRSIWLDRRKWRAFEDFLKAVKGKADTVVVRAPEVLGDTYREFVLNLAALGDAGLKLEVLPSETRDETVGVLILGENGKQEEIVERQKTPMMTNMKSEAKPSREKVKSGIALLQKGRRPVHAIQSNGPDEVYCQAEILLKFEKERYKPTNLNHAIVGIYLLGPGTLDEFLYQYEGEHADLERIERFRLEILRKGWESFVIAAEDAAPFLEEVKIEEIE